MQIGFRHDRIVSRERANSLRHTEYLFAFYLDIAKMHNMMWRTEVLIKIRNMGVA